MDTPEDLQFEIQFFENVLKNLPKDFQTVEILGHLYTLDGRIEDGLKMDKLAVKLSPENALAHYNLACSLALLGKNALALKSLSNSISLGYDDIDWLLNDEDLKSLHTLPEFHKIIKSIPFID